MHTIERTQGFILMVVKMYLMYLLLHCPGKKQNLKLSASFCITKETRRRFFPGYTTPSVVPSVRVVQSMSVLHVSAFILYLETLKCSIFRFVCMLAMYMPYLLTQVPPYSPPKSYLARGHSIRMRWWPRLSAAQYIQLCFSPLALTYLRLIHHGA